MKFRNILSGLSVFTLISVVSTAEAAGKPAAKAAPSTSSSGGGWGSEPWYKTTSKGVKDVYAGLGIGGEFYAGDAYDNIDPRFRLQFDAAWHNWAMPLGLSFGDDAIVLSLNPRYQYWFHPFSGQFAKLGIAPAVGPNFGFTFYSKSGIEYDMIDMGLTTAAVLKYDFTPQWGVTFTPVSMSYQFFRDISFNSSAKALGAKDDSNSDFGFVYTMTVGAVYNF